jgi:7tm Chemosensory receptor
MNALKLSFKQLYIFGKLFGVLPYSFDNRSNTFHRSLPAQLHTFTMLVLSSFAHPLVTGLFIRRVDLNHETGSVGSRIVTIYRYANFGMMLTYSLQLYYQKRIVKYLNSGLRIAEALLQQIPQSYGRRFYALHLVQLLMSFIWCILFALILLSFFKDPDLIDVVNSVAVVSPVLGMGALSAAFVLCMGLVLRCYTNIGGEIKVLFRQQTNPKSMTKQCQLSDDLDQLKIYYRQLGEVLQALVQVLSVPIFFFISMAFASAVRGVS